MGAVANLILIIILIVIVLVFWQKILALVQLGTSLITNPQPELNFTLNNNVTNSSQASQNVSYNALINYTLHLINRDRGEYGLANVSLSPELSAQQHADSMLQDNYFSHWDLYDMKPYMRYTLLGGRGAVQENVAYTKSGLRACLGSLCKSYGNINVSSSLDDMEYNMMYNDSACCNNGHRYNILDSSHNQVSLGVAYNSTSVYLVEDFINNYITWLNNTPSFGNGEVHLKGVISQNYTLSTLEISYDPMLVNQSVQQLDNTSEYSYGRSIAGVVGSSIDYYPNLTTIVADSYYVHNNDLAMSFNMSSLIGSYGPGEYTLILWLNDTNTTSSFIGSTYTIFINQSGSAYLPSHV
jgi:uncharacterized protein YkwD